MSFQPSPFLRRVLVADALASGGSGLLMTLGASHLDGLLGLPATLLFLAGVVLIPYAGVVGMLAARPAVSRAAIWAIVACNAFWAIDSLALLVTGWVSPSGLGYAYVIAQALVVALFAELQYMGLRRAPAALA